MEKFLQLNWNPDVNDLVDNVFIKEERILKESVMYRIMSGTFRDPFGIMRFEEISKKLPEKPPEKPTPQPKRKNKKKKKKQFNTKMNKTEESSYV